MKKFGIYKIINKKTGDFYIGSSNNFQNRFGVHKNHLKNNTHCNSYLQRVFNKYGNENINFEVIEYMIDETLLLEREQFYIDTLIPKYNLRKIASSNLGFKHSEETKKKMSKTHKGKKLSDKTKEKIRLANIGKKLSEKTKRKMSEAKKNPSEEHRLKLSKNNARYWLGKSRSSKTKQKISEANLGKYPSELTRQRLSLAAKGRNSKPFKIKSPEGKIIEGVNLFKFCKENKLDDSHMNSVIHNKRIHHKGWTKV